MFLKSACNVLAGEVQRDRWLTREEMQRLIAACAPHLAALARFALATACRAREITGLEWNRVDVACKTAWLDRTKNGTPRGVPLNQDAVEVLSGERGKHPVFCFTYRGEPLRQVRDGESVARSKPDRVAT